MLAAKGSLRARLLWRRGALGGVGRRCYASKGGSSSGGGPGAGTALAVFAAAGAGAAVARPDLVREAATALPALQPLVPAAEAARRALDGILFPSASAPPPQAPPRGGAPEAAAKAPAPEAPEAPVQAATAANARVEPEQEKKQEEQGEEKPVEKEGEGEAKPAGKKSAAGKKKKQEKKQEKSEAQEPRSAATQTTGSSLGSQQEKVGGKRSGGNVQDPVEAMRLGLEADLVKDLHDLDDESLRYRLENLTAELEETNKLEALRQHDLWRRAEAETARKYSMKREMERQRLETAFDLGVAAVQSEGERRLASAIRDKEATIAAEKRELSELQEERIRKYYLHQLHLGQQEAGLEATTIHGKTFEESRQAISAVTKQRVADLSRMEKDLELLDAQLTSLGSVASTAQQRHQQLAGVLSEVLVAGQGVSAADLAIASAPSGAQVSVPQLQERYAEVHRAAMSSAMVPQGLSGATGQFFGWLIAALNLPERAPRTQLSGSETKLTAAASSVSSGDLYAAVQTLESLDGLPRQVVEDWLQDTTNYLLREQASATATASARLKR